MSDGEGFRGQTSENQPLDPLDDDFQTLGVGREIDSPVSSSRYSSCGESEFDRYCSANSVMGTPSLCSSVGAFHECVDSDFGESTRSVGTVEGDLGLEGFNLGGRFAGNLEDEGQLPIKSSSLLGKAFHGATHPRVISGSSYVPEQTRVVDGSNGGLKKNTDDQKTSKEDLGMLLNNVEDVLKEGAISVRTIGETMFDDMHTDDSHLMRRGNELLVQSGFGSRTCQRSMEIEERDDDGYEEQDGTSSRDEHSEGEDSMVNSGSDGEKSIHAHYMRHSRYEREVESNGRNMILMSSSVAFGSNDWEDFELERMENDTTSQMLGESWQEAMSSGAELNHATLTSLAPPSLGNIEGQEQVEGVRGIPLVSDKVHDTAESPKSAGRLVNPVDCFKSREKDILETTRDASIIYEKDYSDDESIEYLEDCHVYNIFEKPNPISRVGSLNGIADKDNHFDLAEQASGHDENQISKDIDHLCNQEQLGSPADVMVGQVPGSTKDIFEDLATKGVLRDEQAESFDEYRLNSLSSGPAGNMGMIRNEFEHAKTKLPPSKGKGVELNAFYDEVVQDMEEILLDSVDSPVTRLNQSNLMSNSHQPPVLRDDGSTASTSGAVDGYPLTFQHARIDEIEVVGAKQKKGDISLSERLVGVKEHTVYVIRVWSVEDQWEVERRYRDFYTLYRRLKSLFADQGWILPSSWSAVEWESRKIFGNSSPDVVLERSALIEECLRSVLQFSYPSGLPDALVWFLTPPKALPGSPQSNSPYDQSAIGNTISLIVDIRPHKSVKQTLEEQHFTCPGCHSHLDGGKTRFREFVQTFGLGKPRLCEYTGQLFCSSCHTNDTAVLPARVLHHWDFTEYPVSQLAKFYLDSIIDQPMLCVSAVNPFLLSKVKVLLHVVSIRRKIRALLDYVHCPFRGSIYRGLGSRRYLLETTDFFSLRNLIDLSKGAFAVLPMILETILKKIQEHITEQCLVCCDIGVPCGARQSCNDISSLIFPFQDEDEVRRCHSCKLPFHKRCFAKLTECSCGTHLKLDDASRSMSRLNLVPSRGDNGADGALSLFRMRSDLGLRSSAGFLSALLSTERREKSATDHRDGNNVILMGSFPGNSP